MNKIFWTSQHCSGEENKGHEHYGKYCVIAISPQPDGFCYLFTGENDYIHNAFDSNREMFQFITQSNKISYAKIFNTNYELVFIEHDSEEWEDAYEKWETFLHNVLRLKEYTELPWWKRIFIKFKWNI